MTAIYDLAPDALRAKVAEREQWAAEARAADWTEEAKMHERMAKLYRLRIEQMHREGADVCGNALEATSQP